MQEDIDALKKRIESLESSTKKDKWDKLKISAGFMVPIVLALLGYFYSDVQKAADLAREHEQTIRDSIAAHFQLQMERSKFLQDSTLAEINAGIAQAGTIADLFDELLESRPERQQLAFKAIMIALPYEGPKLVQELSQAATDEGTQQRAGKSLNKHLIAELFSSISERRLIAYNEITDNLRSKSEFVTELLDYADQHMDNENGVYNTLVVLSRMDRGVLDEHAARIEKFCKDVKALERPKTNQRIEKLRMKMGK